MRKASLTVCVLLALLPFGRPHFFASVGRSVAALASLGFAPLSLFRFAKSTSPPSLASLVQSSMCFDLASSFIAWGLANSASWFLFQRNRGYDRWNASFITCFSTIQILEAGLWAGHQPPPSSRANSPPRADAPPPQPAGKVFTNEFLTKLIILGLTAQPAIQTIAGYKYTHQPILWYMSWVFVGFFIYTLMRTLRAKPGEYHSKVGEKGHWIWSPGLAPGFGVLYLIGLFFPLLFMKDGKGLSLLLVGMGTAAYSLFAAGKGEFGSLWCFTAVLYSVAAILV